MLLNFAAASVMCSLSQIKILFLAFNLIHARIPYKTEYITAYNTSYVYHELDLLPCLNRSRQQVDMRVACR